MPLKKYKPITAGTRWRVGNAYTEITTNQPERSLLAKKSKTGGRNSQGRRSMRYIGGGNRNHYRIIDFKRSKREVPAKVATIEYDPNRTAFIALLHYVDGEKRYIIAPQGMKVGDSIVASDAAAPELGNALMLRNMPLGTIVHNIEMQPGAGGVIARSAGTSAQLSSKEGKFAGLKMPSGEIRRVPLDCYATIGVVSNQDHSLESLGKAGRNRWKGRRPRTRGVAMNPVDHPMGGGEGRASGGHPRSRTGLLAKGLKTRKRNKYSDQYIIQTRSGKKLK